MNTNKISTFCRGMAERVGFYKYHDLTLELINDPPENRPNRMCVSVSDIHLTDGTVGFQNLGKHSWDAFYNAIRQRCISYKIQEMVLVLDGDIVDMIRSSKWAEAEVYPWEREKKAEFSKIVNDIIKDIVGDKHKFFCSWLRELEGKLVGDSETNVETVKIVVLLGNHDKELLCDNDALKYFYEEGLGIKLSKISVGERKALGRMYGEETLFTDKKVAPYLPFYFGDRGFRFFTTHGQWRDKENSSHVKAEGDKPDWSAGKGWDIEAWQKLSFSPFLLPCFGDTVAAGVLSTFIYKAKDKLKVLKNEQQKKLKNKPGELEPVLDDLEQLNCILDELDLYRPTYAAVNRILDEAADMRESGKGEEAIKIIEETLYECIMEWLSWEFTYESSPLSRCIILRIAKRVLELMKTVGHGLEITAIAALMKSLSWFNRYQQPGVSLSEMKGFPSFLPAYRHYQFQIHGEGHTHQPLEEEPNFDTDHPTTYINFGTWRDQIVLRKKDGYRRRGVLRALFILDLVNQSKASGEKRAFDYFVMDVMHWGDFKDALDQSGRAEPKL